MRIAMIGSGYVGLVAGACLADTGNDVVVADIDAERIARLRAGECPLYEPGLGEILARNTAAGRLTFTTDTRAGVADRDVVLLAVGTPTGTDGGLDLSHVEAAAVDVAQGLTRWGVVVLKSTVPVGTHARVRALLAEHATAPHAVVSNPEFLKEGTAVQDFRSPDRVIIGADDPRAVEVMRRLYAPLMRRSERVLVMDPASAELTKVACNAMLAARVAFMNELSGLCEQVGADIDQIRAGMGTDPRIGPQFLYASLGIGGSCLPKDVAGLQWLGHAHDTPLRLVGATLDANRAQQERFVARVLDALGGDVRGRVIAQWGLAFKANTDDVRMSPAIAVARALRERGATLRVHDPAALDTGRRALGDEGVRYHTDPYDAIDGADALIVATEWPQYRQPDLARMATQMRGRVIVDGRNLYALAWMKDSPFTYHSVGRPTVRP